ncbi:enoyl-CoA hydratase/isomerase family protein [Nonomuraea sp. NPDC059194]|uniref:enoyl-CoA hydratase/isomerase family protein n=1 Tax=Nonomuraea sp. NPDC059194 TaxID=3346764 RepID=UPI0036B31B86
MLVKLEDDGEVATIVLNRPERHNSLVPDLLEDFLEAVARVKAAAVVLAAEGRSFSTGGDLRAFADLAARADDPRVPVTSDPRLAVTSDPRLASTGYTLAARGDGSLIAVNGDSRRAVIGDSLGAVTGDPLIAGDRERGRTGEGNEALAGYAHRIVGLLNQAILALLRLDVPVVAAVHGPVTGGALGLVLACDVVLVSPEATFQPWYTTVGFGPDGGWTAMLPQRIGTARAAAIQVLDEPIDAATAVAWGLAHRIEPDVRQAARRTAERAARKRAVGVTKRLINGDLDEVAARLEAERVAFVRQIVTSEAAEGMAAFRATRDRSPTRRRAASDAPPANRRTASARAASARAANDRAANDRAASARAASDPPLTPTDQETSVPAFSPRQDTHGGAR